MAKRPRRDLPIERRKFNPAERRSKQPDWMRHYSEYRRRADSSTTNTTDEAWLTVNKALRSKRRKVRDRWS